MLSEYEQKLRQEFMDGMNGLLDWMMEHPNMPAPLSMGTANIYAATKERLAVLRRDCGLTDKLHRDRKYEYAGFQKEFGPAVKLELFIEREKVCQKVKVGEKVVPATPETVVPAKPETVEPIYEWQCTDPLLQPEPVELEHASV